MLTDNQEVDLMAAYLTSDLSDQCLRFLLKFREVCIGFYGDELLTGKAEGYIPRPLMMTSYGYNIYQPEQ